MLQRLPTGACGSLVVATAGGDTVVGDQQAHGGNWS
jgi:hypothetical protein